MVLGSYYLTMEEEGVDGNGKVLTDMAEMEMAYANKDVDIHAKVKVRVTKDIDGKKVTRLVESTVGRFLFNQIIPQDLGFIKREGADDIFKLEIDCVVDKSTLSQIVYQCFVQFGAAKTSILLDDIKKLGFSYSTKGAITIGIYDMQVPEAKAQILSDADQEIDVIYINSRVVFTRMKSARKRR
jgi:DNA-directed RNA polymerase subunit beta'